MVSNQVDDLKVNVRRFTTLARNESGSVITETAIVLSLLAIILSATINFSVQLKERSLVSEALRFAAREAARSQPVTFGLPSTATTLSDADFLSTIRLLLDARLGQAGLDSADYQISTNLARVIYSSPATPISTGYLRIGIRSVSIARGQFGTQFLGGVCKSSLSWVNVVNPNDIPLSAEELPTVCN